MDRKEYGYYIEILKNGEPIAELQVEAQHDRTITDKRTLNSIGRITCSDGDKITAKLTSRENNDVDIGHQKGKYSVDVTMSLERVALF